MTPDELKAIRDRCEAASEGPWAMLYLEQLEGMKYPEARDEPRVVNDSDFICDGDKHFMSTRNLDFIAHSRTDIPKLLDEVERLRELVEAMRDSSRSIISCTSDIEEVAAEAIGYD